METLANLESFVRSAELGSFSAAARKLALTPAAVSRNVAQLERNLGVRLFQRSTRGLALTEAGEQFRQSVTPGLDSIQNAIAGVRIQAGRPSGKLKISAPPAFGRDYLLPLMPAFLQQFGGVTPDWHFDNRQVDLVAEGFDAAIGGGIEITPGMVARTLAPLHVIAVSSPRYLAGRPAIREPADLAGVDAIIMRSVPTGRLRAWMLASKEGGEVTLDMQPRMIANDPEAVCQAVLAGAGVGMVGVPHALPHLESGEMVRLLPGWYADAGTISLYYAGNRLLPAKTRVFVEFVVEAFRTRDWARRFSAA